MQHTYLRGTIGMQILVGSQGQRLDDYSSLEQAKFGNEDRIPMHKVLVSSKHFGRELGMHPVG
ncbi:MAG: hypothetical protein RLY14_2412 [Planctomycetota bacterium]|jgi:hypothetical protein